MKTIIALVLVLFATIGAKAQTPIKVTVKMLTADAQEITDRLKAKIGGTSRYAVYESPTAVSLIVGVTCIHLHEEGGGPVWGYACDSVITYFPDMGRCTEVFLKHKCSFLAPQWGILCRGSL